MDAVRSVVAQRTSPHDVEIIVIKDFRDPEIDRYLGSESIQTIEFGSQVYGLTIARAVRACHGEIVAFLEDDDAFDPRKVERLRVVFEPGHGAAYYHNDYQEIDEAGRTGSTSPQRRDVDRRIRGRGVERYHGPATWKSFRRILDSVPEAHLSCVAIRRSELERILERLASVPIGVDFFLFFAGLASEGGLVIDPEKLTLYRRHPANSSRSLAVDPSWYERLTDGTERMAAATRAMLKDRNAVSLLPQLEEVLAWHE